MTENLHNVMKKLSRTEIAVLARAVQLKWPERHKGVLVFLDRQEVADCMLELITTNLACSIEKRIYAKIKSNQQTGKLVALSDAKVYRRFGSHPERGVTLPGIVSHNVYRARRPFERKKDAYDIRQSVVSLKRVGTNRWIVNCREAVLPAVLEWLTDNCGG